MALPRVLAGPILRRVESRLVTVWIALSEPADVTLSVWTTIASAGAGPGLFAGPAPNFTSSPTAALRVCDRLHVAVVTVDIEPPEMLFPSTTPSYNVTFTTDGATHDLKSEGLLQANDFDGHLHEPLGYVEFDLPSFAMPPPETTELRLLHYSCRRPHERGPDALGFVDDMIADNRENATERPHLLFMTGDQIYADDVAKPLLPILTDLGRELLGSVRETAVAENPVSGDDEQVEISQDNFPAGFRSDYIKHRAGLTSDTSSHLLSFGEYAAMYLAVWNNRFWPTPEPDGSFPRTKFQLFDELTESIEPTTDDLIATWNDLFRPPDLGLGTTDLEDFIKHMFLTIPSSNLMRFFDTQSDKQFDTSTLKDEKLEKLDDDDRKRFELTYGFAEAIGAERREAFRKFIGYLQGRFNGSQEGSETDLDHMALMYEALPKVRRAMANVPCYMMWDDHDVTDDWYLTGGWRDQVLTKDTGVTVLRNGMLAGALFQLWGNDPKAFVADPDPDHPNSKRAQFLADVALLYPDGATEVSQSAANDLNELFGLDGAPDPPLQWHFQVDGPRFMALVLDTRTRRAFRGPQMPPMLFGEGGFDDQIPKQPALAGLDVVFVVSPVPVLGPPVDELIARPLAARATDYFAARKNKRPEGHVKMDVEWWSADEVTFEELLSRLEPYKKVVFLSGDVHHGLGAALDYWKDGEPEPARFVQFTSSPAKNILPIDIAVPIAGAFAFSQRIMRLGVPLERLRWEEQAPTPVSVPGGQVARPSLRAALRRTPVLIPTHAWPGGTTTTRPADSSWRLTLLSDDRPDAERPTSVQPKDLPADFDALEPIAQYRVLMDRHIDYVKKNSFGRVFVLSNNIGLVRFSREEADAPLEARHELWSIHPDQAGGKPLPYTIHRALVEPTTDAPPELS